MKAFPWESSSSIEMCFSVIIEGSHEKHTLSEMVFEMMVVISTVRWFDSLDEERINPIQSKFENHIRIGVHKSLRISTKQWMEYIISERTQITPVEVFLSLAIDIRFSERIFFYLLDIWVYFFLENFSYTSVILIMPMTITELDESFESHPEFIESESSKRTFIHRGYLFEVIYRVLRQTVYVSRCLMCSTNRSIDHPRSVMTSESFHFSLSNSFIFILGERSWRSGSQNNS